MKQHIGVGMVGAGQIGKSHLLAHSTMPMVFGHDALTISFPIVAEATEELAKTAAARLGFARGTGRWREVTDSDSVDLVDIIAPTYLHAEPAIDAAEHGKHLLCEKPLATSAALAEEMYRAADKAGVVSMVGFNYRRLAAVTFCKELVSAGELGRVYQFRSSFMEDWPASPKFGLTWRFKAETAGAGVVADLGSHVLDLARFIVGEISSVCATQGRFVDDRPLMDKPDKKDRVDVDDTTMCLLKFQDGTMGRIDTSWVAWGRKVALEFEINGSEGSAYYNLEKPNEVQLYYPDGDLEKQGFRTILMGPVHPYGRSMVFPAFGAGMGFEESLINEVHDLYDAIMKNGKATPSFYDGWRVNRLIEAITESAKNERWVSVS